ncbi:hydroxymethylglutaryl-CoA synthase family protein [Hydrogenophaga crocea]|uniref:3-hydroxy-3-methylglutaryl CoA synthase n=1 Tax=Hydrogenophaga crocea TaxID=2716225 RepID=A0A6G8IL78_9BURK|nr:3-oxoacyl-[acyl-carrier-protein] synthase III C-terminal domain-containing protein [Hydrogenophaga crocea]QIM53778.1 3-hydroxy-3-methylglutaryl CoA synthase [Hydrogenophaga crocea]
MIGITAYGGYIPRLRLSRQAVGEANAWYAPQLRGRPGTRSLANWDEDSVTMAVAAARDCLGAAPDRQALRALLLASNTLPFAERLNAGIAAGALRLDDGIEALDLGGTPRAGLSALCQGLARARAGLGDTLVLAADQRHTRPASAQELEVGDGAAALVVGSGAVLAQWLGSGVVSVDFVDHFRATGETVDYHWEERWVREEGIARLVPQAVAQALAEAGVDAAAVDHFIFPTPFARLDGQIAQRCGVRAAALADNLADTVGDTGTPHALLMLAHTLERAQPGQLILLAQFGSGAQALVFRVTDHVRHARPARGVSGWLARGVEERQYTKFLAFKGTLALERGMRGEQDRKTALSTAWRHRQALLGLVGGRCRVTGQVQFPPGRLSLAPGQWLQDTQEPYPLADRGARIASWSAEYLSWHPAPPHHYGQIDFDGGGRLLMDFTDLEVGDVEVGTAMELVFRIKDRDDRRGFTRYFWKATPLRGPASAT